MTLAMARPRQGTVGERNRSVHLFEASHEQTTVDHLTALCGSQFEPSDLEFLKDVIGMPCELCLCRTPSPTLAGEHCSLDSNPILNLHVSRHPHQDVCPQDDHAQFDEPEGGDATTAALANHGNTERNDSRFDPTSDPLRYRYELLADHLAHLITTGQLPPNKPLPAERRLANEYGVSLGTARRATDELRLRGLVYTLRSKGTFVLPAEQQQTNNVEID